MAKSSLKGLLESIQEAIVGSQELMQQQHIDDLSKFLDDDGNPITHKLKIPKGIDENGDQQFVEADVPLMTLSPPSSLRIKKLKISFEAMLTGHDEACEHSEKDAKIHLHLGGGSLFNRGAKVKCEIIFEGTEPPEGWMRINDELMKVIP